MNPTPTPTPTPTPGDQTAGELANYKCPTYDDNYTSVAAWTQRSKWNLANMHDPTVVKASDGYYYMYQTDASYGIRRISATATSTDTFSAAAPRIS